MSKRKSLKTKLSTLFLIIIIIIVSYFAFKLYNEKILKSGKIKNLNNQINYLDNTIDDSQEKLNNISNIKLDGIYGFENSDVGYEFDKNGNASIFGNVIEEKGTYTIYENGDIKIVLTEEINYDIEAGTSSSKTINRVEKLKYIDENTLLLDNEKLIKFNYSEIDSVSYIVLELEDIEAEERNQQGLEYKTKNISDKQKIDSFMEVIENATIYEAKTFIPDFGDIPPAAEIYFSNGDHFRVFAGDEYDDDGNIVNLMCKYYNEDGSDKTLYKLNTRLGEYINNLFDE